MSEQRVDQERPCLHCMIAELIRDFFAEYPATSSGSDTVDSDEADEVMDAIAKTVAELTCQQDGMIRQQLMEHLIGGNNALRCGVSQRGCNLPTRLLCAALVQLRRRCDFYSDSLLCLFPDCNARRRNDRQYFAFNLEIAPPLAPQPGRAPTNVNVNDEDVVTSIW